MEKLLFPPFRRQAENKLPVADAPPEFRSGSDTWLEGSLRPSGGRGVPAERDAAPLPVPRLGSPDLHPFAGARSCTARLARPRLARALSVPAERGSLARLLAASLLRSEPLRSARDESLQWHEFNFTLFILQPLYHVDSLTSTPDSTLQGGARGEAGEGGPGEGGGGVGGEEEEEEAREGAGAAFPSLPVLRATLTPAAHPARGRKVAAGVDEAGSRGLGEPRQLRP